MPTVAHGGWAAGVNLQNVLNEALAHARLPGYTHLGTTATIRETRVAEMVNRVLEEILEACPILCLTTTTQALTVGTAAYNVPSDVHGSAIERLYWADAGNNITYDLKEIPFLNDAGISQLPASWRNGEVTYDRPEYWGFNRLRTQWRLFPGPATVYTVTIQYRQEPTSISQANVNSPGSVTIGEIPTRWANVLAMGLAVKLLEPLESMAPFRLELRARAEEQQLMMQRQLSQALADKKAGNRDAARPNPVMNLNSIFMFRPLSGRRLIR